MSVQFNISTQNNKTISDIEYREKFRKEMTKQTESCYSDFTLYNKGGLFRSSSLFDGIKLDHSQYKIDYFLGLNKDLFEYSELSARAPIFCQFFELAIDTIAELKDSDIPTMLTDKPSETALKLSQLFTMLEKHGFRGAEKREIAFWSGDSARAILDAPDRILTDLRLPLYCGMMTLFPSIKNLKDFEPMRVRFCEAICTHLASQARGDVKVFVSNGQGQARHILFHNYFWNAELPALQTLRNMGVVSSIKIYFLNESNTNEVKWHAPVDINGQEMNDIELVQRKDPSSTKHSHITFGTLRKVINKWKSLIKHPKVSDKKQEV